MNKLYNKQIINILVFQIVILTIKNTIFCNYNAFIRLNGITNILIMGITLAALLITIAINHAKVYLVAFSGIMLSAVIAFCIGSFIVYPIIIQYSAIQSSLMDFAAYTFLAVLFLPAIHDPSYIINCFYKYTTVMFVACILSFYLFRLNGSRDINGLTYSMAYGKNAVFLCLIMLSRFFNTRKVVYMIEAAIVTLTIILIGSRYPLLYIFTYIIVEYLIRTKISVKKIVVCGLAVIAILTLPLWLNSVFNFLSAFLNSRGIRSRTLSYLLGGNIMSDSNRNAIHERLIQGINTSPIFGYGFGGSVIILNGEFAHGFVYDAFGTFGYGLGTVIVVSSFIYIISSFIKEYKTDTGEMMIVLMCAFFPTIFIQDDFWGAYKYWWLLIIAYVIRKNRRTKKYRWILR